MLETLKNIANSYAEELCSDAIHPAHLFKAVLHKEAGLVHFIESEMGSSACRNVPLYVYLLHWLLREWDSVLTS